MEEREVIIRELRPKLEPMLREAGISWHDAEAILQSEPISGLKKCIESGDTRALAGKIQNHSLHHPVKHSPRNTRSPRQYINGHKNVRKQDHGADHDDGHHGGCCAQ